MPFSIKCGQSPQSHSRRVSNTWGAHAARTPALTDEASVLAAAHQDAVSHVFVGHDVGLEAARVLVLGAVEPPAPQERVAACSHQTKGSCQM